MDKDAVLDIFKETKALLSGHFKLSSGLHSAEYLQCALVLQYPDIACRLGTAVADMFKEHAVTCVAGPALGGVIIAHEVARALGARCVFGERQDGKMALRRGFKVGPGDRVLVVEDVVTTGGSAKELLEVIKNSGAEIAGVGTIVDRSPGNIELGYDIKSLIKLEVQTFDPSRCPLCKEGLPLTKPGSRK
ncbi:MAG: orotate phosphoribosyltransferase [Candidatus Omnitrophica bacterium]|nr:orotate phosphoribosyltransferase [Candidatus Omnitrophota bacterium]